MHGMVHNLVKEYVLFLHLKSDQKYMLFWPHVHDAPK